MRKFLAVNIAIVFKRCPLNDKDFIEPYEKVSLGPIRTPLLPSTPRLRIIIS